MDCRASLAETEMRHGERSAAIHLGGARRWTAALRSQRRTFYGSRYGHLYACGTDDSL